MNIQPKRRYEAQVRDGEFTATKEFFASNRRKAVKLAVWWFWYEYKGTRGCARDSLIVTDPYSEVRYDSRFSCADRMNRFLPPDVIDRLIKESNGELIRNERKSQRGVAIGELRRVKRRRDFGRFVAPGIRQMRNGVMYYRITTLPEKKEGGKLMRRRKYRDIRLRARTIVAAVDEVKSRNLVDQNNSARRMKVRDLFFVLHVSGALVASELTDGQKRKYEHVLKKYRKETVAH
jgi:hypothetical protein